MPTYSEWCSDKSEVTLLANNLALSLSVLTGCSTAKTHDALRIVNPLVSVVDDVPVLATADELPQVMRSLGEVLRKG